jgi:hypothetical protein
MCLRLECKKLLKKKRVHQARDRNPGLFVLELPPEKWRTELKLNSLHID